MGGAEEVRLSEANTIAMRDWEKVMQSPSVKNGMHGMHGTYRVV